MNAPGPAANGSRSDGRRVCSLRLPRSCPSYLLEFGESYQFLHPIVATIKDFGNNFVIIASIVFVVSQNLAIDNQILVNDNQILVSDNQVLINDIQILINDIQILVSDNQVLVNDIQIRRVIRR